MLGIFRDGHPRLTMALPCTNGLLETEFIVDTGFEGDLAVPDSIARQLVARSSGSVIRLLADGSPHRCPILEVELDSELASRTVEVLVLAGYPAGNDTVPELPFADRSDRRRRIVSRAALTSQSRCMI